MTEDKTERFKELQKQAKTGNTEAMYNLAHAYRKGEGTEQALEQFFYWINEAVKKDYLPAMVDLGMAYRKGEGTEKDLNQFLHWTRRTAEANYPAAMFNLAIAYRDGMGTKEDLEQYFHWMKRAAEAGIPRAMFNLAMAYIESEDQDLEQFFHWMKRAAEANYPAAMFNLALAYRKGEGTENDLEQYFQWTKKAAEAGFSVAMFNLALAYRNGEGTENDLEQYFQWTKKAAEANYPSAMVNLGVAYTKGVGTEKDLEQALYWTKKVAKTGMPEAMFNLDLAYIEGEDAGKNLNQYFQKMGKAYMAKVPIPFIAFLIVRLLQTGMLDERKRHETLKALLTLKQECEGIILKHHCVDEGVRLSHYTKFSALNNILQGGNSNHLRLYNVAYFNDPLEGMPLPNAFGDVMRRFFYGDQDEISHEIEAGGKLFSVYVCAFTANEDRLDMWRAYGNNGDGYSITSTVPNHMKAGEEFGVMQQMQHRITSFPEDIQEPSPESDAPKDDDKISIYKVLYGVAAQEAFERLKEPLKTLKRILDGIDNEEVSQKTKALAIQILADLRYLYKHEAYELEEEYRIIRVIDVGSEKLEHEEISQTSPQPPRFYIKTPPFLFQEEGCKITIGPRVTGKAAAEIYIKQQLHENKWHKTTKVVHSKMPYR